MGLLKLYEESIARFAAGAADDLGRLLMSAASAVSGATLAALASEGHPGIHPSHVALFAHIDPGGTSITALAERAGVSRQAMSVVVRELEPLGYVATSPDPQDRRATRVTLTALGARFCEDATATSDRITREWAVSLGDQGIDDLRAVLRLLASHPAEKGRPSG
jgi:DNA-binding MarR family transcriptional regulator